MPTQADFDDYRKWTGSNFLFYTRTRAGREDSFKLNDVRSTFDRRGEVRQTAGKMTVL